MRMRFLVVLFSLLTIALYAQEAVPDTTAPIALIPQTAMKINAGQLATAPFRGVNAALAQVPGVVQIDGHLHMRGGRSDEIGFYVEGLNVNRPMGGTNSLPLIHNAIESVTVYTGGAPAHLGGHLSGAVETRLKTGGDKLKLTGEIISDDFWAIKDDRGAYEVLGIDELYSFGYNDYVLTLGGPVPKTGGRLKFFIAGQAWNQASEASWYEGFIQDSLRLTKTWYDRNVKPVTDTLDLYIDSPPGRIPGKRNGGHKVNASLVYDQQPLNVRAGFFYAFQKNRTSSTYPGAFHDVTGATQPYVESWRTTAVTLALNHQVSPSFSYSVHGGLWHRLYEGKDGQWGDDFIKYGDPALNPALLDASLARSFPLPFDDQFKVWYPGTPWNNYQKNNERRLQIGLDLSKVVTPAWTVNLGGKYAKETIRRYSLNAFALYNRLLDVEEERAWGHQYTEYDIYAALFPRMIGYDWSGNEVDDDMIVGTWQGVYRETPINIRNKPMTPLHVSAYVENRLQLKDLSLSATLRLDHFRTGWWSIKDWKYLHEQPGCVLDDEKDIGKEKQRSYVTPRVALSVPVGRNSYFHAQAGRYVQAPDATETWASRGYTVLLNRIFKAGYFSPSPNPNLRPLKSTLIEGGVDLALGRSARLDLTVFHKDNTDLLTRRSIVPISTAYRAPTVALNKDFSQAVGLSARLSFRPNRHVQGHVFYSCTRAIGTGANVSSHNDIALWEEWPHFPNHPYPLDFDVRHQLRATLQANTFAGEGPSLFGVHWLEQLSLHATGYIRSGAPYTPIAINSSYSEVYDYNCPQPSAAMNSGRLPWLCQVDVHLGRRFTVGPVQAEVYLWALNLFNMKNMVDVFRQTGRPETDGWLSSTAEGKKKIQDRGQDWLNWYNAVLTDCGSFGWQPPRQLRLGVRVEI